MIPFAAHQNFTVGFDNIVKRLENPPTDDLQNFCGYLESWATAILHHHDTEAKRARNLVFHCLTNRTL